MTRYEEGTREEAVALAREKGTKQAARETGVNVTTLRGWMTDSSKQERLVKRVETLEGEVADLKEQINELVREANEQSRMIQGCGKQIHFLNAQVSEGRFSPPTRRPSP